jgi:hypothetical protein
VSALPGSFREQVAEDAALVFADPDTFGEEITYYPAGDTTKPRTIRALVYRGELGPRPEDELIQAVTVRLRIPNHALYGITAHTGADLADVVCRIGETAKRVHVLRVIDGDEGMWHLEAIV